VERRSLALLHWIRTGRSIITTPRLRLLCIVPYHRSGYIDDVQLLSCTAHSDILNTTFDVHPGPSPSSILFTQWLRCEVKPQYQLLGNDSDGTGAFSVARGKLYSLVTGINDSAMTYPPNAGYDYEQIHVRTQVDGVNATRSFQVSISEKKFG
jgi:hypothetical protein